MVANALGGNKTDPQDNEEQSVYGEAVLLETPAEVITPAAAVDEKKGSKKSKAGKSAEIDPSTIHFSALEKIMLANKGLPESQDELEILLAQEGVDLSSPAIMKQIEARVELIRKQGEKNTRERPEGYAKARNWFLAGRDYSAFGANFLFMVVGVPLATMLLFGSELFATALGISTFMADQILAVGLTAGTLVMAYFALEWRFAALQHRYGKMPKSYATLGHYWRPLVYFFTHNEQVIAPIKDTAVNDLPLINGVRRVIIYMIVLLGIIGRLHNLISTSTAVWYQALVNIFTTSTLAQFLDYVAGGFISLTLLVATHFIMGYLYEVYVSAVGSDEVSFFDAEAIEIKKQEAMAALFRHKLLQLWAQREEDVREQAKIVRLYKSQQKVLAMGNNPDSTPAMITATAIKQPVEAE